MVGAILTTEALRDYLGVDSGKDREIESIRASAISYISNATGMNWESAEETDVFDENFNEALRIQAWISYFAVRDSAKNTTFLQEVLINKIAQLRAGVMLNGV